MKNKRNYLSILPLLIFLHSPAEAASVSYFMNQSNTLGDGPNYLQVTIDDQGAPGDINFMVQTLSPLNSIATSGFGIDQFGFNTNRVITSSNITNLPTNWSYAGLGNMDGFGKFTVRPDTNGANNRISLLTFSISGIAGDVISDYVMLSSGNAGQGNEYFAAHVAGFDSYGSTSAYFAGSTTVPVPAAVWLMGSGLAGLAAFAKTKRRKK